MGNTHIKKLGHRAPKIINFGNICSRRIDRMSFTSDKDSTSHRRIFEQSYRKKDLFKVNCLNIEVGVQTFQKVKIFEKLYFRRVDN